MKLPRADRRARGARLGHLERQLKISAIDNKGDHSSAIGAHRTSRLGLAVRMDRSDSMRQDTPRPLSPMISPARLLASNHCAGVG